MKRLLAVLALIAFAAGCASTEEQWSEAEQEQEQVEFFDPVQPTERPEPSADIEHTVSVTSDGNTIHEPPPSEATPELPPFDEVPSIEVQIQQCTEQTGLPEACRNKIEHGVIE